MLKVGIVGVTGYTGLELLKLCDRHPDISVSYLGVRQDPGRKLSDVYPQFSHLELSLTLFEPGQLPKLDVLFLALPHGITNEIMADILRNKGLRVIDLSADYRLSDPELFKQYYGIDHAHKELLSEFSYGLPEIFRKEIHSARHCANPGCYSTCSILGLYPLAAQQLLAGGTIIIDGKSGVSGAGKTLKESSLYCEANENVSSYGTFKHRHVAEIQQVIQRDVFFSPHLIPMDRGIMCSIYVENTMALSEKELVNLYQETYRDEPFIKVFGQEHRPNTKDVAGTNECHIGIHLYDDSDRVAIFSVLDNLMKGAASQAMQNFNIMFGLSELLGIR